jgi:hypothetical protein
VITVEKLRQFESQVALEYDREKLRDVVNVLRAVGCVLSGTALLMREVRHLTQIQRPRREHPPRQDQKRRISFRLPALRKEKDTMETMLYRPVGPEELALIAASGYQAFPPRLPDQPIFYPVTNEEYATQIARDWNVKASGAGFVTRFAVRSDYLAAYKVETVGSSVHQEYWIPAGELPAFNEAIVGNIEVIAEFHADKGT